MMHTDATQTFSHPQQTITHEHAWMLESAHNTSDGMVLYVRCGAGCGARRIDRQGLIETPPSAVSKVVGG